MKKRGIVMFLLFVVVFIPFTITVKAVTKNSIKQKDVTIASQEKSNTKIYTRTQDSVYGDLSLTVEYKMVNNKPQIIKLSHDCKDECMSFYYCKSNDEYSKVVYKDNTGHCLHGARISVTIYADELS